MVSPPAVSVVIRSRNEETWIRHCLAGVFAQRGVDFDVIIVDNNSCDNTVAVARRFPIKSVLTIDDYSPGKALNLGIAEAKGEFVALISAHCVPTSEDWLLTLLQAFDSETIAGVYGKQVPMGFTDPVDRNDLYMAFGEEKRTQVKDWFFHNANSMIRRTVWKQVPFDTETTNIEDRIWAKEAISKGFAVFYEPSAEVFHHNGLHRTSDSRRIRNHVEIIEAGRRKSDFQIPESMLPENARVVALLPVSASNVTIPGFSTYFESTLRDLDSAKFIDEVVVVSPEGNLGTEDSYRIKRSTLGASQEISLSELLRSAVVWFEENQNIPDYYLYMNWDYSARPRGYLDQLVKTSREEGYDSVFGAREDYQHLWVFDASGRDFKEVDPSLRSREYRNPVYRAFYGLGTLTSASILRQGKLTGGRVGIVKIRQGEQVSRVGEN